MWSNKPGSYLSRKRGIFYFVRRVPEGCVIHSFRHSMRDRLRAIEGPPDIFDRLGGWTVGGVGEGYRLEVLHRWMNRDIWEHS